MKNRSLQPRPKNGKFFCWHSWKIAGEVGPDWDIVVGIKLPALCTKCDKYKKVPTYYIKEVPDGLINRRIRYLLNG